MKYIVWSVILVLLTGCYKVGYEDFLDFKDARIGGKMYAKKPYRYKNSGQLNRGDFEIVGKGLTHISRNKNGDLVYHIDEAEILPRYGKQEWVGKCKFFYIVDPKTYIIKSWGFDKGGNPLSCRTWS